MNFKHMLPPGIFEVIERSGISTTKQIMTLSIWDIKKYTNLSVDDILLVKNIVSQSVCPKIVSGDILRKDNHLKTRISTGCNIIDGILKGGLRRGTITELFGESGCGKTQLALQIALNNWSKGSVYICTEDLFPVKRFEELKRGLPTFDSNIDYGKNVFVEHVTEANELLSCINVRLPKLLAHNKLSVVIIDSIAAPFRCETTNYIKRAEELREIAILLTAIAQKHETAVLCINQVTASFDDTATVLPSLGLAWSNMVTYRLMMEKTMKVVDLDHQLSCNVRDLSITFAPDLPNDTIEFIITPSGIKTLKT